MKTMKKLLGVVLALALCAALFALPVAAECVHSYGVGVYHAPTCTQQGYMEYTCTICGESVRDGYVDATGHFYGEWQPVREATCTTNGLDKRICRICGGVETRTTDLLAHTDADGNGFCDVCNFELNPSEDKGISPHEWFVQLIHNIINWFRAIFA